MPIDINFVDKIVYVTESTVTVTVQEFVNAIRDAEDDPLNMGYDKVIDAEGKANLGGGITTGITLALSPDWQIQFWAGVGMGFITGGNLIGGVGDEPIKPTGGNDTIKLLGAEASTIVETGVSGLSEEESIQLMAIPNETLTPEEHNQLINNVALEGTALAIKAESDKIPSLEANIDFLKDVEGGKWELDSVNKQMVFYKSDNVTMVARFALKDASGKPSIRNVHQRVRV